MEKSETIHGQSTNEITMAYRMVVYKANNTCTIKCIRISMGWGKSEYEREIELNRKRKEKGNYIYKTYSE